MGAVYCAKWILSDTGEILQNGAVGVDGQLITSVGPRSRAKRSSDDRLINLGDVLLLPGFINMHTHLEDSVVRGMPKEPDDTFAAWTTKRNSRVRNTDPALHEAAVRLTVRELLAEGITTVVDSSRLGISNRVLSEESIRSWVIQEIHCDEESQEASVAEASLERCAAIPGRINFGVGPYSIYSLSPRMQRTLISRSHDLHLLWATHLAESSEELQAFSEHTGDLFFHITRKRTWPFGEKCPGSPHFAITSNLIPNGGICFHCNYVTGHELSLLAAKRVSIVFCFRYGTDAGHKTLPLDVALNRGIQVCVGTEGIADPGFMSLFDELFAIKSAYPHIPPLTMIRWVTQNAANALGMGGKLGSLTPGKLADIIAVRFPHDPAADLLDELLTEEPEIAMVMVDGEEVIVNY